MNKSLILILSTFLFGFGISSANTGIPDTIIEIQPLIEQSLDLKNYPLRRNLPYASLDKVFNKYCSVKSIEEGLSESEQKYSQIRDELSINCSSKITLFQKI